MSGSWGCGRGKPGGMTLKAEAGLSPVGGARPAGGIIGKLIWVNWLTLRDKRSLLFNRRSFKIFLRSP